MLLERILDPRVGKLRDVAQSRPSAAVEGDEYAVGLDPSHGAHLDAALLHGRVVVHRGPARGGVLPVGTQGHLRATRGDVDGHHDAVHEFPLWKFSDGLRDERIREVAHLDPRVHGPGDCDEAPSLVHLLDKAGDFRARRELRDGRDRPFDLPGFRLERGCLHGEVHLAALADAQHPNLHSLADGMKLPGLGSRVIRDVRDVDAAVLPGVELHEHAAAAGRNLGDDTRNLGAGNHGSLVHRSKRHDNLLPRDVGVKRGHRNALTDGEP